MANGDSVFVGKLIKGIIIAAAISFTGFAAVSGLRVLSLASAQEDYKTRLCKVEKKADDNQENNSATRERVARNESRYEAILRALERIEKKLP